MQKCHLSMICLKSTLRILTIPMGHLLMETQMDRLPGRPPAIHKVLPVVLQRRKENPPVKSLATLFKGYH
jgi:hypothetical protein